MSNVLYWLFKDRFWNINIFGVVVPITLGVIFGLPETGIGWLMWIAIILAVSAFDTAMTIRYGRR